jgi:multimeric flavodoxin WrbA
LVQRFKKENGEIKMRLIISDVNNIAASQTDVVITPATVNKAVHCTGCFNCWIKTPGECGLRDQLPQMGELLARCDELILISECVYGSVSPFVKNVLDRSIGYILPTFKIVNQVMRHQQRYDRSFIMRSYFYGGNLLEEEKITAQNLVNAMSKNLYGEVKAIEFAESADLLANYIRHQD